MRSISAAPPMNQKRILKHERRSGKKSIFSAWAVRRLSVTEAYGQNFFLMLALSAYTVPIQRVPNACPANIKRI